MSLAEPLRERLRELHERTVETPLFNPVFQLGHELSRRIEEGELSLGDVDALVSELECDALMSRAGRLRRLVGPIDPLENESRFRKLLGPDGFETFAAIWSRPVGHIVFTAHPTFLLNRAQSAALAEAASSDAGADTTVCVPALPREPITLDFEHRSALEAMTRAQSARDRLTRLILGHAKAQWPDRWSELSPLSFRFASWVGYDMDGRTDIKWSTSVRYRLLEKAERLERYSAALDRSAREVAVRLRRAAVYAGQMAERFATDLDEPAALSDAANALTADHADKLTSLAPVIAELEALPPSVELATLIAAMRADGLGMGWIHFRVNASQLHNAIRRRIDPNNRLDLSSQAARVTLHKALAKVKPLKSNMAALAIESSTAIRQFLAMAQILHHVDGDAPIRMLVAECEQPATVLAALYFAKLFGIEDKVDVSPLFETETALEHGGRFLDALLAEEAYRDYARVRGRVAIQTGFSDAGRFVGQIPAALAIERLQGRLVDAMTANGLTDVAALIFNTHGESMGRGAHPSSVADRVEWPLSPWARRRFAKAGVTLEPEVSFQGGDGYLFFGTPELALATLTRFAEAAMAPLTEEPDPFYRRTDLSLDFYRSIRDQQQAYLRSRTYPRAVTAFGLGLLNETGSRKSRRQSDLAAEREMSLRQIRAIPHNAVLQQLGYPANVIAGFGTAADGRQEEMAELLTVSPRGRQLVRLVRAANSLASIKTVAAFGELFNSAYWASRPYRGTEPRLADACLVLADRLTKDDRTGVFRRLASRLRVDGLKLHRLLALIPDEQPLEGREEVRRRLGALQALRLALIQHMFLRAVMIPAFSRANDISRDDVLDMVFALRIDDALAQLRRAFPTSFPSLKDFAVNEPTDYPEREDGGYSAIERDFIEPIAAAQALILRIGTAIANEFGAHG
jgi:phosphoenolpyruvate carboxylase